MRLKTAEEIAAMRRAGEILAITLRTMAEAIEPGKTTTLELDEIAGETLAKHGAEAPLNGYTPSFSKVPYAHNTCISINNEVIHGVPRADRVIQSGDLVSLDMDASVDGWCADAAFSVVVGGGTGADQALVTTAERALAAGIAAARPGARLGDVGHAIAAVARGAGYGLLAGHGGHGVGRSMHEEPHVPNEGRAGRGMRLRPGLVIAIEPMLTAGGRDGYRHDPDGWTVRTADGSRSAHAEHTIAVTRDGPRILTAGARTTAPARAAHRPASCAPAEVRG